MREVIPMKKCMLLLVMSLCVQDAVCSFGGSFRRFSSVGGAAISSFSDFQRKYPTSTGIGIGFLLSLLGGVGANELHQRTLGNERAESILRKQNDQAEAQKEMHNTLQEILANQKQINTALIVEQQAVQFALLNQRVGALESKVAPLEKTVFFYAVSPMTLEESLMTDVKRA